MLYRCYIGDILGLYIGIMGKWKLLYYSGMILGLIVGFYA